jgi:hypothetical protein
MPAQTASLPQEIPLTAKLAGISFFCFFAVIITSLSIQGY